MEGLELTSFGLGKLNTEKELEPSHVQRDGQDLFVCIKLDAPFLDTSQMTSFKYVHIYNCEKFKVQTTFSSNIVGTGELLPGK